jgi:putative transposase
MAASIAEDCRRAKVPLFAYEVMPNHSHLLVAPQEGVSVADAMKRIKSNSARRIRPTLSEERLGQLSKQTGLNRRTFWQQSFRSVPVITDSVFQQKESYTIWNPVKAGYCDLPEDYRWSGAHARLLQLVDQDGGLDLNAIVNLYAPQGLPHF